MFKSVRKLISFIKKNSHQYKSAFKSEMHCQISSSIIKTYTTSKWEVRSISPRLFVSLHVCAPCKPRAVSPSQASALMCLHLILQHLAELMRKAAEGLPITQIPTMQVPGIHPLSFAFLFHYVLFNLSIHVLRICNYFACLLVPRYHSYFVVQFWFVICFKCKKSKQYLALHTL